MLPFWRRAVKLLCHKRSLALRLLKLLAGALALVGGPAGLAVWALASPRFTLAQVTVTGSDRVAAAWVRAQLAPLQGRNLLRLPLADVDQALAGHPWLAAVAIEKRLPDALAVAVAERRPAALILRAGALWWADAQGRPIAAVADDEPAGDLLLVTRAAEAGGGSGAPPAPSRPPARPTLASLTTAPGDVPLALRVAAELEASEPEWAAGLTWVEALSDDDARLHSAALLFPVVVTAGRVELPARRLAELLPELRRRYRRLAAVDLRFSRRIVVQLAIGVEVGQT